MAVAERQQDQPQPIPQEMQRRIQLWRGQGTAQGNKYANAIIKEWR